MRDKRKNLSERDARHYRVRNRSGGEIDIKGKVIVRT